MKLYNFIFRTWDGAIRAPHELVGYAYMESSEQLFDFLIGSYKTEDEQYDCKIVPSTTGHPITCAAECIQIILAHDINREVLEQGFTENDIFAGDGYDHILYDGDCVFVCCHSIIGEERHVNTTSLPEFVKYSNEHSRWRDEK